MIVLGILLGTVGQDIYTGTPRFVFGVRELYGGLNFVSVAVGMFGVAEILRNLEAAPPALEATLAGLTDPSGIRAELECIRRALPDDPAGAIGAAKQLVEATAKVVLTERHLPVAADAKVLNS